MTWIKQYYDRFLVALFAGALLACAGLLFFYAHSFASVFASLSDQVPHKTTIKPVNKEAIEAAEARLQKPDIWEMRLLNNRRLPLFDSVPYISKTETDPSGNAKETLIDPITSEEPIHPPVPNKWLMDNKQDLLSPDVLTQDSDGDGFTTLDEFEGKTDPNDKASHPQYWTKLFLKRFVRIPFRLVFDARNGTTLQINTLDLDEPTQFVKVGDNIKGTKFKVTNFAEKHATVDGISKDVSEVTLTNPDNGEIIVLPKQQEVDSPTTYAVLAYLWAGKEFAVKKNQEFTLQPDETVKYKCVDLSNTDVVVLKEDENKQLHIKMLPPGK